MCFSLSSRGDECMNLHKYVLHIFLFAIGDSFSSSNKSGFKRHLHLPFCLFSSLLNVYNRALVKSRTFFMFESLMMYFLLGLWLFITASNWRARCWIKVKATRKNITKRKLARHQFVWKHECFSWSLWALCARRLGRLHTVIHLTSISLTVFLPANRECDTF